MEPIQLDLKGQVLIDSKTSTTSQPLAAKKQAFYKQGGLASDAVRTMIEKTTQYIIYNMIKVKHIIPLTHVTVSIAVPYLISNCFSPLSINCFSACCCYSNLSNFNRQQISMSFFYNKKSRDDHHNMPPCCTATPVSSIACFLPLSYHCCLPIVDRLELQFKVEAVIQAVAVPSLLLNYE